MFMPNMKSTFISFHCERRLRKNILFFMTLILNDENLLIEFNFDMTNPILIYQIFLNTVPLLTMNSS